MDALEKALDQYRLEVGAFPNVEQGLDALMTQPAGVPKWQGPYLKKAVPRILGGMPTFTNYPNRNVKWTSFLWAPTTSPTAPAMPQTLRCRLPNDGHSFFCTDWYQ